VPPIEAAKERQGLGLEGAKAMAEWAPRANAPGVGYSPRELRLGVLDGSEALEHFFPKPCGRKRDRSDQVSGLVEPVSAWRMLCGHEVPFQSPRRFRHPAPFAGALCCWPVPQDAARA